MSELVRVKGVGREGGIENEAEEKVCVHIPGEVQKSLAE